MLPKKVAILQSSYIPWKGYFDIIDRVDEFVIYDVVQYTKRDWRNRNRIKTPQGLKWLTIPVDSKGKYTQAICEVMITDPEWYKKHWQIWLQNYKKAPFFKVYKEVIEALYERCAGVKLLTDVNQIFLKGICDILSINTSFTLASDYSCADLTKIDRLIAICKQAGATSYLSGPAAKDYIEDGHFSEAGLQLEYMSYDHYSPYPQLHGDFEHGVSIIDLLFNVGEETLNYIRGDVQVESKVVV